MGVAEEGITSLSGAPPKLDKSLEIKSTQPQKRGIDYSKFDKIEDSDDEKPERGVQKDAAAEKAPEKPHCHNCHKDITKPLRCGVCKKVEYCSAACQKDDWRFHKRMCKKPEEPKAKKEPTEKRQQATEEKKKKQQEEEVVEEEEKLDWYRHREWKPANEPKKEFRPTQITAEQAQSQVAAAEKPAAGSAWNAAGTWEDKDVTAYAHKTLKEALDALGSIDIAGGSLTVVGISDLEGDASKPVIRGIQRHMFDFSFKVKFVFKWMGSEGQKQAEGHIQVSDFTDNAFAPGAQSAPVVELSFRGESLDAARRQAVEAALGTDAWPPKAHTLLGQAAARMEAWSKEYTLAAA